MKPVTLVLHHASPRRLCSERQGRNHAQLNPDKHQTQILNTFLLWDYCVTKCTFQTIKLNSSSHLCQNNLSSFSSFILKIFWKVACVTDKKTFPVLFWVCGLDAEPPGVCWSVLQGRFVLRHVEAGRDTAATVSVRIYWLVTKPHVSVWMAEIPVLPSSGGQWLLFCDSDLHSLFSFYNIPSGRPRIFCVIRRKKDIVGGKLKVNTDVT